MRLLALLWRRFCLTGCGCVIVLALPCSLAERPPRIPEGVTACSLTLPGTPRKPQPYECWDALASWYGSTFQGQTTASGGSFSMYAATAAHPTLPLGSIIRISNPRTGRSMVVTINDRGPYVPGRGLDVSYEVARLLGFAEQGICRVKIEFLKLPATTWLSTHAKN